MVLDLCGGGGEVAAVAGVEVVTGGDGSEWLDVLRSPTCRTSSCVMLEVGGAAGYLVGPLGLTR